MFPDDVPLWSVLLVTAVALMLGHYFRVLRWSLLTQPFVTARTSHYFLALSLGYVGNFLLPLRLGELLRTLALARLGRARFSHILAGVIIERWLDLLCILAIAFGFTALGILQIDNAAVRIGPTLAISGLIGVVLLLAALHHSLFRRLASFAAAPFNERLSRNILALAWATAQLTDYLRRSVSILRLTVYTVLMWVAYGTFILALARLLQYFGSALSVNETFEALYLYPLTWAGLQSIWQLDLSTGATVAFAGYLLLPVVVVVAYLGYSGFVLDSLIRRGLRNLDVLLQVDVGTRQLNIFLNPEDEMAFLKSYASGEDHRALLLAFHANQDIQVLKDLSGSSRAHTVLAQRGDRIFYRKYALGNEAGRLTDQLAWLQKFHKRLPLTETCGTYSDEGYVAYDMTYWPGCSPLFDALHALPVEKGAQLLDRLLDRLNEELHQPTGTTTGAAAEAYFEEKLWQNLKFLWQGGALAGLLKSPSLIVNSEPVTGWPQLCQALERMNLPARLTERSCPVHGDLTIENIVYAPQLEFQAYIIDPNPTQIISNQWLEYGKVAQSLHSGYEFLRNTHCVNISDTEITFNLPRSEQYARLWLQFEKRIGRQGGDAAVQEVLLHEIVHFSRLLPYQVEKNPANAPVFLATFLRLVQNYVAEQV